MAVKAARRVDEQDHRLLAIWASDCAERVLPYFEEKYPEDDRPRKAIEAARAWAHGDLRMLDARKAAVATHAAARDAGTTAARMAARAAGHAAGTAHMPGHARHAAAYAIKATIAAVEVSGDATGAEQEWQY